MPQLPTELLNQIGVVLEIVVAGLTALLVAFWVGLAVWTFRDIRARTRDIFAWLLATLLVLVGGPIGLLLYFLLRPRETVAQVYDRQLEEEALLRDITIHRSCPHCQRVTEPNWLICPHCRTELRHTCANCSQPLELDWVVCPYCATPTETEEGPSSADQVEQIEPSAAPEPSLVTEPAAERIQESPAS